MAVIDADTHVIETDHTWSFLEPSEQRFRPFVISPWARAGCDPLQSCRLPWCEPAVSSLAQRQYSPRPPALFRVRGPWRPLELTDFDLPQAIDNALALVRERAGRRGIALHQAVEAHLGEIKGGERKVKQVLLNLLSKALKFTPEGGTAGTIHNWVNNGTAPCVLAVILIDAKSVEVPN